MLLSMIVEIVSKNQSIMLRKFTQKVFNFPKLQYKFLKNNSKRNFQQIKGDFRQKESLRKQIRNDTFAAAHFHRY
jgi:hypothetical protein